MIAAVLAWLAAALQLVIAAPFLVELLSGLLPRRTAPPFAPGVLPRTVVLMPAHDEARHLPGVLAALLPTMPPGMTLLLVADNCSDGTAAVARVAGADVIERHDPARRGKGYALAFGRDHLVHEPPEVVIVLDADCRAEPGALACLAGVAAEHGTAVQGLSLLAPVTEATAMVQVSGFAFLVKNFVRQRGLSRLGAPVPLGGTGMAVPWSLFRDAPLGGAHLVEDLALSVELARGRHPPRFDPRARIWSDPAGHSATLTQRARWEGGFLQMARTHGPRLLWQGLREGRPGLAWLGLHVMTPPLALLVLLELAATMLAILLALAAPMVGAPAPFGAPLLSLAVLLLLGASILLAWALHGRAWLRPAALLRLPLYLLWKLPAYLRIARGRGATSWVRTEREG